MRKQARIIRDFGLFYIPEQNGVCQNIGYFAFNEIENCFTKRLSNHYFTQSPEYLQKIEKEFNSLWPKSHDSDELDKRLFDIKKS